MRPRLLVSVFALDEVEAALAGGADIVDVKNPAEGSLGAASPHLVRAVRDRTAGLTLLSAALGDAPHLPGTLAFAAAGAAACGADYVKVGLLGSARPDEAAVLLSEVQRAVEGSPHSTRVVAVAYADTARAGGLPPRELPRAASRAGVHGVMLDTAVKDGVSTLKLLGEEGVAAFLDEARSLGLETAIAGSLGLPDVSRLATLGVRVVGVRGSACVGGRGGRVDAARVRALRAALAHNRPDRPAA